NMSRIRSKNTLPEKVLCDLLISNGYKFIRHYDIPGKPDVVFSKIKIAIFVDGEFWHGRDFQSWKDNLNDFWLQKISDNIRRDHRNDRILRKSGWKVVHVWGRVVIKNKKGILKR